MSILRSYFALLLLVVASLPVCISQVTAQTFQVHQYTEADGLPSSDVKGIVQTEDGLLWFATRNGIVRFDGRTWKRFGRNDGLDRIDQMMLRIDSQKRIWSIAPAPAIKIYLFDGERWEQNFPGLTVDNANCLFPLVGKDKSALLGHDTGLLWLSEGTHQNIEFGLKEDVLVYAIAELKGQIYAGTSQGLFHVKLGANPGCVAVKGSPQQPIKGLCVDGTKDRLWVIGRDWIRRFNGESFGEVENTYEDPSAKTYATVHATMTPGGELVFASFTGIFIHRPNEPIQRIGAENGLLSEGTQAMMVDRDGLLWISTPRGVSKVVNLELENYNRDNGLFDDEVASVFERADGTIVLGHNGGLTFYRDSFQKTLRLGDVKNNRVLDMAETTDGVLWVAARESGIFRFDTEGNTLEQIKAKPEWANRVNSVIVSPNDEVWFATNGVVYRYDNGEFEPHPFREVKSRNSLRRLFFDQQGRLLIATVYDGIWRLEQNEWQRVGTADDQDILNAYSYLDRNQNEALIGSAKGLFRVVGNEVSKSALPSIDRPVYFIQEDQSGNLWFGTDNGVYRWSGNQLRHISVSHGLAGRETNRAASLVDKKGRIWIGTAKGLSVIRPEFDSAPDLPPLLSLVQAKSGEFSWDPVQAQSMPYHQNAVTFNIRALSFPDENRIRIRSRLDGINSTWTESTPHGDIFAAYNFLPPGNYQFHVQAANAYGTWSDIVSSAEFQIRAPFWRTTWFYSLVLIGVTALGVFSHRFYSQRRYTLRLENEVASRIAELQQSEHRFGVTLSSINDGVITTGMSGDILFMNPVAEKIVGKTFAEARGQSISEIFIIQDNESHADSLQKHICDGTEWASIKPIPLVWANGSLRLVDVSVAPLRGSHQRHIGTVVAIRDVTERNRLQKELANSQKLASLGTLAGGIAHDFNNLLGIIIWNISSLKLNPRDSDRQTAISRAEEAILQARDLTQQLVTFSRGGTPTLRSQHLRPLIEESASLVVDSDHIRCDLEIAEDLWPVEIDTGQINQVFNNILINAKQAMPSGGTIRVVASNRIEQGPTGEKKTVVVEIEDTGCGIPASQIDRVFEPYFTTKTTGTGIGLATSFSIIQQHEGKLIVESEVGHGSKIIIMLPASQRLPVVSAPDSEPSIVESGRILIIDDDSGIQKSLSAMLTSVGFQATAVSSSDQAIEAYRRQFDSGHSFDAVFVDLNLEGERDGGETIKKLLQIDPFVHGIAISGYVDDEVLVNYQNYGFKDRLQKPCTLAELQNLLARLPKARGSNQAKSG